MKRREIIVTLLEHYLDVQPGLVDTDGGDGLGGLNAAGCWKHSSYRELEKLCGELSGMRSELYWHLAETYFRSPAKRVAYCPRCRAQAPSAKIGNVHRHANGRTSKLVPKTVRMVSKSVSPKLVARSIDWLDENWRTDREPFLPDDLR